VKSNDVLDEWAERSGAYSPDYYAYYGPDETSERVRALLDERVNTPDPILELGCSSGRHLRHLQEEGYDDLHGIDVNADAFEVMAEEYPELAHGMRFYADPIEEVVPDFDDDAFGAVFSVETLQHVHPENEWVFDELVRVADDLIVTVEHEGPAEAEAADAADAEAADAEAADGEMTDAEATDSKATDAEPVNYVHDEFPLYYRDWNAVFTDRGCEQVAIAELDRDTLRAFRPPNA